MGKDDLVTPGGINPRHCEGYALATPEEALHLRVNIDRYCQCMHGTLAVVHIWAGKVDTCGEYCMCTVLPLTVVTRVSGHHPVVEHG